MGRPSAYPNDPLPRLRDKLSEIWGIKATRELLARRTEIPEPTLRDIENRKFKLSEDVAMRISYAVGVHPRSLMDNDDPFLDFTGEPFSKASTKTSRFDYLAGMPLYQEAHQQLLEALWETALGKKVGMLVAYSFEQWVASTCSTFGLNLDKELTKRLDKIDPVELPAEFHPRGKLADQWKAHETEITAVQSRLFEEYKASTDHDAVTDHLQHAECRTTALKKMAEVKSEAKKARARLKAA